MMFVKFGYLFLIFALVAGPIQAESETLHHEDVEAALALIERLINIYRTLQSSELFEELGIFNLELPDFIDLERIRHFILTYYTIFPDQITCILKVLSDPQIQQDLDDLTAEIDRIIFLVNLRDLQLTECNSIGGANPSSIHILAQQHCRIQVFSTTGAEITTANVKIRLLITKLNVVGLQASLCMVAPNQ